MKIRRVITMIKVMLTMKMIMIILMIIMIIIMWKFQKIRIVLIALQPSPPGMYLIRPTSDTSGCKTFTYN
jgi:hypothetical protein